MEHGGDGEVSSELVPPPSPEPDVVPQLDGVDHLDKVLHVLRRGCGDVSAVLAVAVPADFGIGQPGYPERDLVAEPLLAEAAPGGMGDGQAFLPSRADPKHPGFVLIAFLRPLVRSA